jgi:hypothetical protein
MQALSRLFAILAIVCLCQPASVLAGYVNTIFAPGSTLFSNPLDLGAYDLNNLLPPPFVPAGTTVSLWDSTTRTYGNTSVLSGGAWSLDFTLNPGTGARLTTSINFTNTFVGNVLNHDGTPLLGPPTPPPVYTGPNGIFLLADACPTTDTGTDIFLNILGRQPNVGEQVITLSSTSTYLGSGNWSGGVPTLNVGRSAFLNVGPVPEPTTLALGGLGLALAGMIRRCRK